MLTLGSLFDGIGGWLLAAQHAGIEPIWASEIAPFPASVTAHHFPNVVQLGDITGIQDLPPVDIVTCGSPCQDLSVAGKRKGLSGERSGLFIRAVELVRRLRMSTGGRYPRFFVWENVPGAFSSNKGMDFRAVLEEITETEIPMPEGGRWAQAGMVELPSCQIAWRVLDAQHAVPQRRKRIFLVADFAAERRCAREVLLVEPRLSRNIAESGETRERTAAGTESGAHGASGIVAAGFKAGAGADAGGLGYQVEQMPTLTSAESGTQRPTVAVYDMTHADEVMRPVEDGKCQTLNARMRTGGNQVPVISYAIAGNIIGREDQNGGHQLGIGGDISFTLNTVDRHAVFTQQAFGQYENTGKASALKARDYKDATDLVAAVDCRNGREQDINGTLQAKPNGGTSLNLNNVVRQQKTVRRLTPLELMNGDEFDATKGNEILRLLRETYGEETVSKWCLAILERIQQAEVLQQGVHEESVCVEAAHGDKLDDGSLPCAKTIAEWLLRDLRKRKECGCAPQGRKPAKQQQREFDARMSELPCETPSSVKALCDMWRAAQGAWLLLQTLAAFQKIWESAYVESGRAIKTVRRLTPLEAERLQGLPDGYTLIDDKTCSDTARYKALGNGMAQPCADYVIRRIVEAVRDEQRSGNR